MECCICGKKVGIMSSSPLSNDSYSSGYHLCSECNEKLKKLRKGDRGVFYEFREIKKNLTDEIVLNCIDQIEKSQSSFSEIVQEETREKEIKELEIKTKYNTLQTTTGYNFEGYSITQYLDIVNSECIIGTGFLSELSASIDDIFGTSSNAFENKLDQARQQAITKLKTKTIHIGGNAIIGVDFDYVTFANNMIGVIASGTAVIVETL